MAKIIGLPKLSPTMDEGTIVKWVKKEGDAVEVDDLLAEVETDKATMEFRSFDKGVLLKILAPEGSALAPDAPVMIIGQKGEDVSAMIPSASAPAAAAAEAPAAPAAKSTSAAAETPAKTSEKAGIAPALAAAPSTTSDGRVLASPYVRKVARELGVALQGVQGTGPHGRIIKRDVDNLKSGGTRKRSAASKATTSQKLSSMRRTIARRLTESKQTVPHFYLTIDIDAEPIWYAREQINKALEAEGEKISVNDLILKACALSLRQMPEVNASFAGENIEYHGRVDISVAVAIPDGLVTPVVRDADEKDVREISREVRSLAARAKDKKLKPEEMSNGTFSISNLGMFDIESFSAVINPPEGAILAVGTVRDEPVVKNGAVVAGKRMRMTMSCDHRVVDGATGAKWLQVLKRYLEAPVTMFI